MNKHRIRMTNLPDDPIPLLFVEVVPDLWREMWINLSEHDDLHCQLHQFLNDMEFSAHFPLTYHSRTFWLYDDLKDYQESVIE